MTVVFHLVRHPAHDRLGRDLVGRGDATRVTEDGRRQAQALATRFAAAAPVAVTSSPRWRCRDAALAIAGRSGQSVAVDPGLDEIDFGDWTGRSFEALAGTAAWSDWNERRDQVRPPGGESMAEAQARIAGYLDRTARAFGEGTVIAVTHADLIKAAVAHVLGTDLRFHHRFDIDPGSVSTLVWGGWGMKLLTLNEACR